MNKPTNLKSTTEDRRTQFNNTKHTQMQTTNGTSRLPNTTKLKTNKKSDDEPNTNEQEHNLPPAGIARLGLT